MRLKKGTIAMEAPRKQIGAIKRRKGSKKLYVDFYYIGHRITRSTELDDTPSNERKVREFLNRITKRIEDGSFKFSEAFPSAKEEEKAYFTKLEGRDYRPEPHQVLFGDYVKEWMKTAFPTFSSPTKRHDYKRIIKGRILPIFRNMTFHQLTGMTVFKFTESLVWKKGKNKGKPVSSSSKSNILIPFRTIWNDACDEYRWVIKSPFDNLEEHYRPIAELMILTGMIPSEMGGLRKEDIEGDFIKLKRSYVLGEEKKTLKNAFRKRQIFITEAIRKRLDKLLEQSKDPFLITMESGTRFTSNRFCKYWKKAVEASGVPPMTSYSTRHSFAAWSLIIGINPLRLSSLMGHASKQMVFEVYGNYVEGLEEDAERILSYFGKDFLTPGKSKSPARFGDSTGDSRTRHLAI
ncbi:MAG: DUF3596 domain-containing protein [Geobacteraceae bacterium]|nr:DUF3596 domain-containing protein [Geobacteraceae bacterium]